MKFWLTLIFVCFAISAQSQTICELNCEIGVSVPVTVFTEADVTVTRYALFINGVPSSVQARVNGGLVDFTYTTGFPRGTFICVIVAYDANGEAWRTESNTLTVKPGKRTVKFR